jgi:hypothetical protein
MSMTPTSLRRFMTELWGDQHEPWRRGHHEDEKSMHTEVLELSHAFPINATATEVPLLAKTSMLDLDKLFPVTRSVSIAVPEAVAAPAPERSSTVQPAPALSVSAVQPAQGDPTPSRPPRSRTTPPPLPAIALRKPTVGMTAVIKKPSRRLPSWVTVSATAVIVLGIGLGAYMMFSGDVERSTGAAFQLPAPPKLPSPVVAAPAPPPSKPAVAPVAEPEPEITIEPLPKPMPYVKKAEPSAPAQKSQTPCTDPLDCQF